MDSTPMPEALRRAVPQLAAEAICDIRDVLRFSEPNVTEDARRMTLYRATDAADTLNAAALLIAAWWQEEGASKSTLRRYLQTGQQRDREPGPQAEDRDHLAALLAPSEEAVGESSLRILGQRLRLPDPGDTSGRFAVPAALRPVRRARLMA